MTLFHFGQSKATHFWSVSHVITASVAYEGNAEIFSGGSVQPKYRFFLGQAVWKLSDHRGRGAMTYINPLLLSAVCDFIILGDALDALPYAVGSCAVILLKETKKNFLMSLRNIHQY